jgi:hypothetical protein
MRETGIITEQQQGSRLATPPKFPVYSQNDWKCKNRIDLVCSNTWLVIC